MLCLALPRGDDGAPIQLFREELISRGWFIQHEKTELPLLQPHAICMNTVDWRLTMPRAHLSILGVAQAILPALNVLVMDLDEQARVLPNDTMTRCPDIPMPRPTDAAWMRLALEQARLAGELGEVPVGAVVIREQEIIGQGHNRNLLDHDPSAHAEIVALRQAAARLGNHRLPGCEIFVTIEPCAMCAGALVHARLSRLVYGASDAKAGAVSSVLQVLNHPGLNHKMEAVSGVLAQECSELLQAFFKQKRKSFSAE